MSTLPPPPAPPTLTPPDASVPTTLPVDPDAAGPMQFVILGGLVVIALGIASAAGVFRRGSIVGPARLDPRRSAWPLLIVLVCGLAAWVGAQAAFGAWKQARRVAAGVVAPLSTADFTAADFAFLSTAPFAIGLLVLVVAGGLTERATGANLGLRGRSLRWGAAQGFVGILIVMPIIFLAAAVLERLYEQVGYQHPTEHELLTVMKTAHGGAEFALLIVGATVMAPLFEELLFRGYFQTLLGRAIGLGRMVWRDALTPPELAPAELAPVGVMPIGEVAAAAAATTPRPGTLPAPSQEIVPAPPSSPLSPPPAPADAAVVVSYASPPVVRERPPIPDAAWQRWAAVVAASVVFALVHPLWSSPLIFILALGLGYAYERTGNLWVPITMHLLFNAIQTTIFLLMTR
jgi:membrane protease YdiL (CAAX protease family)